MLNGIGLSVVNPIHRVYKTGVTTLSILPFRIIIDTLVALTLKLFMTVFDSVS